MTELETIISQPISVPDLSDIRNAPAIFLKSIDIYRHGVTGQILVRDTNDQAAVLTLLKDVRAKIKVGKDRFKVIKDPMNTAKSAVLALEHELLDPLENLEKALSGANSDFILHEQRRVREEADAIARAEREKQMEAARKESAKLEKKGKIGQAVSVMVEAEQMPAPYVAPAPIQTASVVGITSRANYSAKVVDLKALVEHCLANPALLSMFLQPNEVALNTQARSLKAQFNIPGVELVTKYV